jgi:NADH-quinone oxidoreductase subunit C
MLATLDDRLGDRLVVPAELMGDTVELVVRPRDLSDLMRTLRDDEQLRYELMADLCGVDTGVTMQVVYHLWSPLSSAWVRVIADGLSRDDPRVSSVTHLWPGAEWAEREAYDMFGIEFEGNRDLRRMYMPPDYLAHPLRKDFAMPDDASRGPGAGIRHLELTVAPAEVRHEPVVRTSAGAGAVLGADGELLAVGAGGAGQPHAIEAGEEPA